MALLAAGVVLLFLNGSYSVEGAGWGTKNLVFILLVVILAFALVGALISSRLPANPIGWVCLAIGLTLTLATITGEYAVYALQTRPGSLPGAVYMAWLTNWLWVPAVVSGGTFMVLLFPDGRLPSRRWRTVAWLSVAVLISTSASEAFSPGRLAEAPNVTNPFGIVSAGSALELVNTASFFLLSLCFIASALSMIVRYRRSIGEERQQIKWFVAAAVLLAAVFASSFVIPWRIVQDLVTLLFAGLPVAVGIAILRHRLYDIDLLINRALVYGPLTATLALVYVGGVVGLQAVFRGLTGQESTLAVVASTLAIAALFNPLRRWVQAFVDRRFYRRKYDAAKTLDAFSVRLRDETQLDTLSDDLVGVVTRTVQPAYASLWLRPDPSSKGEQAD
ncbi:MAG TPA: hypothetical protein VGP38_02810 [Rubrobacter sp.]|nr:hypothetical protein [Rubrobacter sp.]